MPKKIIAMTGDYAAAKIRLKNLAAISCDLVIIFPIRIPINMVEPYERAVPVLAVLTFGRAERDGCAIFLSVNRFENTLKSASSDIGGEGIIGLVDRKFFDGLRSVKSGSEQQKSKHENFLLLNSTAIPHHSANHIHFFGGSFIPNCAIGMRISTANLDYASSFAVG